MPQLLCYRLDNRVFLCEVALKQDKHATHVIELRKNNFTLRFFTCPIRKYPIFYSTHILSEVSKICDRVGIIKDGHLIEVKDINEICDENSVSVTVKSKEVDKIIKEFKLDIKPYDNTIKFFNKLVKELSKYKVDKVLIEEPTLEDVFLNYYE